MPKKAVHKSKATSQSKKTIHLTLVDATLGITLVHKTASKGDVTGLKEAIRKLPNHLNAKDHTGATPLHHAIRDNQLETARELLISGANPNIFDLILGATPIHIAAQAKNEKAVQLLVSYQADITLRTKHSSLNAISLAKRVPGTEVKYAKNPVATYLRHLPGMGFLKTTLESFEENIFSFLKKEKQKAKQKHKKMLVVIGERYGDFKEYQEEKKILKAAKKLGITTNYTQVKENKIHNPLSFYAQQKLGMTLIGVDKSPVLANYLESKAMNQADMDDYSLDDKVLLESDMAISQEVAKANQPGVLVVGKSHLKGLLETEHSQLDSHQFHIVAFNLSQARASQHTNSSSTQRQFAEDPTKVNQIVDCQISPKGPKVSK